MQATAALRIKQTRRIAIAVALLSVLGIATAVLLPHIRREAFVIPNEKAVAAELLSEKLSGPHYFQSPSLAHSASTQAPAADGEPRISVADAKAQVARIVKERQLDADHAAKLDALIDRLAEPSPSRMTGEPTINLLRLNLAVDEMR